jgi:hypothetical protein
MFWEKEPVNCKFCGKVAYLTEGDVKFASKDSLNYYECPYVNGQFHLTSKVANNEHTKASRRNR